MKKIVLFILLLLAVKLYAQEKLTGNFEISVNVKRVPEAYMAVLSYSEAGTKRLTDSALLIDGKCTFKGLLTEPCQANVMLKKLVADKIKPHIFMSKNVFEFYLAPGKTNIVADTALKTAVFTGTSKYIDDYKFYTDGIKTFRQRNFAGLYNTPTPLLDPGQRKIYLKHKNDSLYAELKKTAYKGFMLSHLSSPVGLLAYQEYAGYIVSDTLETLFNKLSADVKALPTGKRYQVLFSAMHRITIGSTAPDFTIPDTAGKSVSISGFKGKYVLLDFWASWCHPCRMEHPNLVDAYQKYSLKGFTVLSVSVDSKSTRSAWIKAMREDHLSWTNASDLTGWGTVPARLYGIEIVPQNFLIDPNGKVVAINLHGKLLQDKLKELLN